MKFPRRQAPPQTDPQDPRAEEAAVRGEFGIEALEEGEELLDDALFETIQNRFEEARDQAEGGPATESPEASPDRRAAEVEAEDEAVAELLLEEVASGPEQRRRRGDLAAPPATAFEVSQLEAKLLEAQDRETVARLALQLGRRFAAGVALFVVQRDLIAGLRAEIDERERAADGILVPVAAESLFSEVLASGQAVRQRGSQRELDARILRALGRSGEEERLVIPVFLRSRVVSLLYADNGSARLPWTSVAALRALAAGIGSAFEKVILARKQTPKG